MKEAPVTEKTYTHSNHPAFYYEEMLADQPRMAKYRQAIAALVKPGDVVADLGTGLGVLAMMALQAGAARVYAVDNRPGAIMMARRMFEANRLSERAVLVEEDARTVQLDEPVDIIINELIGDFGTDENIYECVREFAKRNLKSGGSILPSRLQTLLVPVQYGDEFRGIWHPDYHGLDLSPGVELPARAEPVLRILREDATELAVPRLLEDITFSASMPDREYAYDVNFQVHSAGTVQGFMGFFTAELVPGISLRNHPVYPTCHWQTWHWPLYPPLGVEPGQELSATVEARPNMVCGGWSLDWKVD